MDDRLKVLLAFALLILVPSGMLALFILEASLLERLGGADRAPRRSPPPAPAEPQGALEVRPDARCRVCFTMIEAEDLVRCGRCRTPHHRDCWNYARRCSTFACGGRESMAP